MEKQIIYRVRLLLLLAAAAILFIYFLFKISRTPNTYSNNFRRYFSKNSLLVATYFKNLNNSDYYFAGINSQGLIGLARYNQNDHLVFANDSFTQCTPVPIGFQPNLVSSPVIYTVTPPYIVSFDGSTGKTIRWIDTLQNNHFNLFDTLNGKPFGVVAPISASSFVVRLPDTSLRRNVLWKYGFSKFIDQPAVHILEKQVDGFFCTDGMLRYDQNEQCLFYVYFYRNEFIRFDTSMQITYRAHTIDTNVSAKIKVGRITNEDRYTFSAPPILINQQCCTGNGYLFIRSGLLADGEDRQLFGKSSVIDVYKLSDGQYQFSYHILDFDGFKMSDFIWKKNHLVAIQGPYITYYPVTY